ncbi:hypothetical protein ACKLNO_01960 [Neisseriaceae bacterium B1]
MQLLSKAWMEDKKQREIVAYCKPNGDFIRHYPDGREEVIKHAQ